MVFDEPQKAQDQGHETVRKFRQMGPISNNIILLLLLSAGPTRYSRLYPSKAVAADFQKSIFSTSKNERASKGRIKRIEMVESFCKVSSRKSV